MNTKTSRNFVQILNHLTAIVFVSLLLKSTNSLTILPTTTSTNIIDGGAIQQHTVKNTHNNFFLMMRHHENNADNNDKNSLRIAFIGNSITYYQDLPRLIEQMLQKKTGKSVYQNSCLRGGASLITLLEKGNGMRNKFGSENAKRDDGSYDIGAPSIKALLEEGEAYTEWDFVVMNDHTQAAARIESREATKIALANEYVPLLKNNVQVIFFQTAAYHSPAINDSKDLGNFDEFTSKVLEGYEGYVKVVPNSKIAPVGLAFQYLYQTNIELWNKLYQLDEFHPSPHGTWLGACVIYCTITNDEPPLYDPTWWNYARYIQPPDTERLTLPTDDEAEILRKAACHVCSIENATNDSCSSRL